ncbi:putative hydrolase of the HAD superfamily [Paenibacillus sp. DS2015]|uniref:HAD family hydrolase n=1 Tax=Paenibacillus sp. DS2015 TaxID=3373917 RepID=UPI003D212D38
MDLRAVIFDLDNTLMDRDDTFRKFSEQFVTEHLSHLVATIQAEIVVDMKVRDADGYRNKQQFFQELVNVLPWENGLSAMDIEQYYNEHYMSHASRMAYVEEALIHCKQRGYVMGIITNGKHHIQREKIDKLQLNEHFHTIVISEDTGIQKPAPQIYQMALDQLGVTADQAVFIGDHPRNDIWGPNQIGIRGIWLRRNHLWDDELNVKPWRIIHELNELVEIL